MAFDVRQHGASGIARPGNVLTLKYLHFKWLHYPHELTETIYDAPGGQPYDSVGIQRAIDAAHAAGGGTVVVPAGDYLIGPIQLRSRVELHLEAGARLWGSPHLEDYDESDSPSPAEDSLNCGFNRELEGLCSRRRRLIAAEEAEDVAITGTGQINAQSPCWVIPWMNSGSPVLSQLQRPTDTILFRHCRRVRVEGVSIVNTPAWTLVLHRCRDVHIRGVHIRSFDVINSDGIDLVNSSNVTIADCNIWCTDDGICLKNTIPDHTMDNIAVSNYVIRTLCNGLKIGTDSLGNTQDITFNNIVIYNPNGDLKDAEGGINLCAVDGGIVRNVNISNIVMRNVDCPFYLLAGLRTAQQLAIRTPRPGLMERIFINNIQSDGTRYTPWIVGHADRPIREIGLTNINVRKTRDFYHQLPRLPVPDQGERYPNPFMFGQFHGRDELPAFGLYLRHVQRAVVSNLRVECQEPDQRKLMFKEQCEDVIVQGCRSTLADVYPVRQRRASHEQKMPQPTPMA